MSRYQLIEGNSLDELKKLPDNHFHSIVTSPPYWQLRDYFCEGQLGMEETPDEFVKSLVEIMSEAKRVLRPDGVMWMVIGDTYSTPKKGNTQDNVNSKLRRDKLHEQGVNKKIQKGMKKKNLLGIPWKVAFGLQDDGWVLRCDTIWEKNNCMPDGAKDRPTRSHEYVFMFTKEEKYFYDNIAIQERAKTTNVTKRKFGAKDQKGTFRKDQDRFFEDNGMRNKRSVWSVPVASSGGKHFACVSEDTECLTISGWKKHHDLKIGEIIASFDYQKTGRLRWERLRDICIYDCDNETLVETSNLNANFILTPNHRMVCQDDKKYYIKEIKNFSQKDKIPVVAEWEDGSYGIGASPSEELAELLGWISSEGYYRKYAVSIYQSLTVNPEKCERIEYLLNHNKINYKKYIRVRYRKDCNNKTYKMVCFRLSGNDAILIRSYMPQKKPTNDMILWSKKTIESFLKGFVGGDGHVKADKRISIAQKDKETMDILQSLSFRCGFRSILSQRKDGGYQLCLANKKTTSFRKTNGGGMSIHNIKYTGKVWCPQTPSSTFVARRNGRIMITGNTFPVKLIEPCILSSASIHGCCSKCGNALKNTKDGKIVSTCECKADTTNCRVLDPFSGTATTGVVCLGNDIDYTGIELNKEYIEVSRERLDDIDPIFGEDR